MSALPVQPERPDGAIPAPPGASRSARWIAATASVAVVAFAAFVPASIAGEQIAWGAALVSLLALTALRGEGVVRTPIDGPLVLHVVTIVLSLSLTFVRGYAPIEAFDAWRLLAIVAVASAFVHSRKTAHRALVALLAVTVAVSLYAIVQRFTGVDLLRHGTAVVLPRSTVAPGRYRVSGLFNAYSTLSMVWVTTLAFFAAAGVELARRWWIRLGVAAASVPALLALAFTEVRAAWLGLLVGLGTAALARGRRAFAVAAAGTVLAVAVLVLAFPAVGAKGATTFHLDYSHNRDRIFMWAHTLEMAGDAPATGIGNGHYVPATRWYFDRWDAAFPMRTHAHDTVIHWWATTGAMGLAAFVWIFVAFFMAVVPAYRRARAEGDRLASALGFGAVAAVAGIVATGVGQTPYFDGEVFYGFVFALAAGLAVAAWKREAPLPRPTVAGVVRVGVPAAVAILVGFTQARWDPSLGALGILTGAGASIRVAAAFAVAGAVFFIGIFPSLRARLRRDPFTLSLVATAALVLVAWIAVVHVLAPAAHVPSEAGPWIPAGALTILAVAFAFRVLLLSPFGWPGIVGVSLVAIAAGAMTHGIEAPEVHLHRWSRSGPVIVGRDDRVAVDALPARDPRRRDAAAVVRFGGPIGRRDCWATVLGGRAILTTDRCGSVFLGRVTVGGEAVRCIRAVDRVPGDDLAAVRCRAAGPRRDLVDLAGGRLGIATAPPHPGETLWRVTRSRVSECTVRRVSGPLVFDDCDGTGPPGAPLVVPGTGRVLAVDLGRTKDGKENRAAIAARILRGRDRDRDGIPDGVDDCLTYDPSQTDSDRDGVGDACEPLLGAAPSGKDLVAYAANGSAGRFRVQSTPQGIRLAPVGPPFALEDLHLAGLGGGVLGGLRWAGIGTGPLGSRARVALVNAWDGALWVLDAKGRPQGHFAFGAESRWVGLAVGRFAGADAPPAVALASNHGRRLVLVRDRHERLHPFAHLQDPVGGRFRALVAVDLDGDGRAEIVAARGGPRVPPSLVVYDLGAHGIVRKRSVPAPGGVEATALAVVHAGAGPVVVALGIDGALRIALAPGPIAGGELQISGGARWIAGAGPGHLLAYRKRDPIVIALSVTGPPYALGAAPGR